MSELVLLLRARLAQLVEQQFCNLQVTRSSRVSGSILIKGHFDDLSLFRSRHLK